MGRFSLFLTATVEDWQLTAVSGLDEVFILVLCGIAAVTVVLTFRSLDPVHSLRIRAAVVLFRTLAIVVGFALLLQPTLHVRSLKSEPARLAVLVDTSGSMTRGTPNRLAKAEKLFGNRLERLRALEKLYRVQWYSFGDKLTTYDDPETLFTSNASGNKTDVAGALKSIAHRRKQSLADGIVLISDGADTELVPGEKGWNLSWAKNLGIPVNTVAIGDAPTHTDLAIASVEVAPFAFSRSETPIAVNLFGVGVEDREVEAFLRQNGAVLQRRTARLVGGKGRLTFNLLPTELGRQVLEVTVPVPEGDRVPENNRRDVTFDVIRDKFRILHLAGRPSFDQRFLRETLKSWPRVDLVSFYVLRTAYQSSSEGSGGMALIPFPTDDLFQDHLSEFDVLIFHEFEPAEVGVDTYAEKIGRFVKDGGALVVVAGEKGLQAGTLGGDPLESLLPVELLKPGRASSRNVDDTPFRARLTEAGLNHPVTRLEEETELNRRTFRALSLLDGVGKVARLSASAQILAEHPGLLADDGPHPVIAVREVEKGRTMVVTTDSLWRWRFTGPMTGGPVEAYSTFWRNAVSWLTRAPELKRLRVDVTPSPVVLGGNAGIDIELLDPSYKPLKGESITVSISWVDPEEGQQLDHFEAKVDGAGRYHRDWLPKGTGAHIVQVTSGSGLLGKQSFLVVTGDREQHRLDIDPAFMEGLAEATGGYFANNAFDPGRVLTNAAKGRDVLSQEVLSLWDHPLSLLLFLLLIFGEWFLRRRMGLD